jgi:soluble lytic murein transglycosylase
MTSVARRRRRRRLIGAGVGAVVLVAIIVVLVAGYTGSLVVPWLSGKAYPIRYQAEITAAAAKYDIDPYLLAGVSRTESGFRPNAKSQDGATGLMQLLPKTAKWVTTLSAWKGSKSPVLTDPQDSLDLGACYLSYLEHRFDHRIAVLAAYNAGPNAVAGWIQKAGGEDAFTAADIPYGETKQFVQRVDHWEGVFKKVHPGAFSTTTTGPSATTPATGT